MAVVFLAHDQKLGRSVALKVLRPELAASLGAERFLREIEIAAKLTHPNILSLYDCGEADGLLYYVMPYVEGESLRERLNRENQLPLEDALQITREVADALGHAHSLGIVHRDIKPENILFTAGHAVVADFGIARAVSEAGGEKLTETGLAVGTPAYMSPEQAAGDREPDSRTDIYALGCVLYEMLGGEPPYTGPSAQALMAKKLSEPTPHISVVRETVPAAVEDAVLKALAKAPADRFATAPQLVDALTASTALPDVSVKRRRRVGRTAAIALAVVLLVAGSRWAFNALGTGADRIEWLAVLPPDNLMGDSLQEYFVAGMHDELISKLSQIPGLDVISRTSAMQYENTDKSIPQIARELNVDAVIESTVLRSGDNVRIQVQLIDPFPRERHLWNDTYDRPIGDILALHSEVALAVAEQIQVTLTPEEAGRLATADVVDPKVYSLYLTGRYHWNRMIADGLERATASLEEAIALDSSFAPAYALLARTHAWRAWGFTGEPPGEELATQAMEAARQALELDETLAEAHAALGFIRFVYDWDWAGAEREFTRAIELNPSDPGSHQEYALFLMAMGQFEKAVAEFTRARELDPLNLFVNTGVGWPYYYARQYDRAIGQFRAVLELDPDYDLAHYNLGLVYVMLRRYDEAIAEFQRAIAIAGAGTLTLFDIDLGRAYAEAGRTEDALEILDGFRELSTRSYVPPSWLASIFIGLGETDSALVWLRRAHDVRDPWMTFLSIEPYLDPLRSEPQFQELLSRMNFPQ